jgi:hypothetical protein
MPQFVTGTFNQGVTPQSFNPMIPAIQSALGAQNIRQAGIKTQFLPDTMRSTIASNYLTPIGMMAQNPALAAGAEPLLKLLAQHVSDLMGGGGKSPYSALGQGASEAVEHPADTYQKVKDWIAGKSTADTGQGASADYDATSGTDQLPTNMNILTKPDDYAAIQPKYGDFFDKLSPLQKAQLQSGYTIPYKTPQGTIKIRFERATGNMHEVG